ncbi:MAG: hypothetical protein C4332_00240 [Meiothermus sp.]
MGILTVLLVMLLLIVLLGLANYLTGRRVMRAQQEWFRQVLPPGVSLEDFLRNAPYTYHPLTSRGYGVVRRDTGEEVWRGKTPEEAEAWIVAQTLAERQDNDERSRKKEGS